MRLARSYSKNVKLNYYPISALPCDVNATEGLHITANNVLFLPAESEKTRTGSKFSAGYLS